jgi:hypothetical protein
VKTLTIKLSEELETCLEMLASRRGESKSALVRAAIEDLVKTAEKRAPGSCLDRAHDLAGSVEGPANLSHDKKYMRGYGR